MGVSAGSKHTLLLRSDGQVDSCGCNIDGQCNIPKLMPGITYVQVSAGARHTILLQSDHHAAACGNNGFGQCSVTTRRKHFMSTKLLTYALDVSQMAVLSNRVVQLSCTYTNNGMMQLECTGLNGETQCTFESF